FNSGQHEKGYKLLEVESAEINAFSLKRQIHPRVFAQFDERHKQRQEKEHAVSKKIPTGIPQFDYHTRGGIDRGTGLLGVARSGVGKTTFLRSLGGNAALRGINVSRIAAGDSTEEETLDGYDAWWTGMDLADLREGKISGADISRIEKAKNAWLGMGGE